jgi:hypothetical protein
MEQGLFGIWNIPTEGIREERLEDRRDNPNTSRLKWKNEYLEGRYRDLREKLPENRNLSEIGLGYKCKERENLKQTGNHACPRF